MQDHEISASLLQLIFGESWPRQGPQLRSSLFGMPCIYSLLTWFFSDSTHGRWIGAYAHESVEILFHPLPWCRCWSISPHKIWRRAEMSNNESALAQERPNSVLIWRPIHLCRCRTAKNNNKHNKGRYFVNDAASFGFEVSSHILEWWF